MKTRMIRMLCAIGTLALLTACGGKTTVSPDSASASGGAAYQKITAEEGKTLLEGGAALTLVDVRRADEYEAAHIPGAVNIPNESIETTPPDALPDLQKTLVVYCRTGVRSKQAAEKLIAMGYGDVRDMGGIVDWPYDTIAGADPGEYATAEGESETASAGLMGRFSATDLESNEIDQSIFADYTLTMVNVWATYCGPCLSEMPELGELAGEYESKGVQIVGMVTDVLNSDGTLSESQLDTARSIVDKTGAAYRHIVPSENLYGLLSPITAVPTTFFVDADGAQVGSAYLGSRSKAEWASIIEQTLEETKK